METKTKVCDTCGVKIFEDRKAQKLFSNIIESFEEDKAEEKKNSFVQEVKELFDLKVVSEEGEFAEFRVTEKDLKTIVAKYV